MTISPDTIVVLSTPGCQRCKTVDRHLNSRGVDHLYIDLTDPENEELLAEFRSRNLTNVPQTFKGDGEWIEGVDLDAVNRLF